jgi:hypothetical protein
MTGNRLSVQRYGFLRRAISPHDGSMSAPASCSPDVPTPETLAPGIGSIPS